MKYDLFCEEASAAQRGSSESAEKAYRTKPFSTEITENSELGEEEQETSSPLAFLTPLLRALSDRSRSLTRKIKKR